MKNSASEGDSNKEHHGKSSRPRNNAGGGKRQEKQIYVPPSVKNREESREPEPAPDNPSDNHHNRKPKSSATSSSSNNRRDGNVAKKSHEKSIPPIEDEKKRPDNPIYNPPPNRTRLNSQNNYQSDNNHPNNSADSIVGINHQQQPSGGNNGGSNNKGGSSTYYNNNSSNTFERNSGNRLRRSKRGGGEAGGGGQHHQQQQQQQQQQHQQSSSSTSATNNKSSTFNQQSSNNNRQRKSSQSDYQGNTNSGGGGRGGVIKSESREFFRGNGRGRGGGGRGRGGGDGGQYNNQHHGHHASYNQYNQSREDLSSFRRGSIDVSEGIGGWGGEVWERGMRPGSPTESINSVASSVSSWSRRRRRNNQHNNNNNSNNQWNASIRRRPNNHNNNNNNNRTNNNPNNQFPDDRSDYGGSRNDLNESGGSYYHNRYHHQQYPFRRGGGRGTGGGSGGHGGQNYGGRPSGSLQDLRDQPVRPPSNNPRRHPSSNKPHRDRDRGGNNKLSGRPPPGPTSPSSTYPSTTTTTTDTHRLSNNQQQQQRTQHQQSSSNQSHRHQQREPANKSEEKKNDESGQAEESRKSGGGEGGKGGNIPGIIRIGGGGDGKRTSREGVKDLDVLLQSNFVEMELGKMDWSAEVEEECRRKAAAQAAGDTDVRETVGPPKPAAASSKQSKQKQQHQSTSSKSSIPGVIHIPQSSNNNNNNDNNKHRSNSPLDHQHQPPPNPPVPSSSSSHPPQKEIDEKRHSDRGGRGGDEEVVGSGRTRPPPRHHQTSESSSTSSTNNPRRGERPIKTNRTYQLPPRLARAQGRSLGGSQRQPGSVDMDEPPPAALSVPPHPSGQHPLPLMGGPPIPPPPQHFDHQVFLHDRPLPAQQQPPNNPPQPPHIHNNPSHVHIKDNLMRVVLPQLNEKCMILKDMLDQSERFRCFKMDKISHIRHEILIGYREILLMNIQLTFEQNLENHMWKNGFYSTIEALRGLHSGAVSEESLAEYTEYLHSVISQGIEFYESLIKEYETRFEFNIADFVHETEPSTAQKRLAAASAAVSTSASPTITTSAPLATPVVVTSQFSSTNQHHFPPLQPASPPPTQPKQTLTTPDETPVDFRLDHGKLTTDLRSSLTISKSTLNIGNTIKVAILSCQRYLVCLGDLARYRKLIERRSEFGEARRWYMKAVQVSPSNGRPYNQLALLAYYTHRRLDAVYFYLRSVSVKHPYLTAKQSILSTFEEIRHQAQTLTSKLQAEISAEKKEEEKRRGLKGQVETGRNRRRIEIWFKGEEGKEEVNEDDSAFLSEAHRMKSLLLKGGTIDMHRNMVVYFLDVIRQLVTKIGLENFERFSECGLVVLSDLLGRPQSPLNPSTLLQFTTLALFTVHNAAKDMEEGQCTEQFNGSMQFVLSLWGCMLNQLRVEIVENSWKLDVATMSEPVQRILPSLRLISTWMSLPSVYALYSQLSSLDGIDSQVFSCDIWHNLAEVCNAVSQLERENNLEMECSSSSKEDVTYCQPTVLPEDLSITSFFTAFDAKPPIFYVKTDADLFKTAMDIRINSIVNTADYLCDREDKDWRHISLDSESGRFVAVVKQSSPLQSMKSSRHSLLSAAAADSQRQQELVGGPFQQSSSTSSADILLSNPADEDVAAVQQRLQLHRIQEDNKAAARQEEEFGDYGGTRLEIRPQYLVPDTNAFIDHLPLFKRLFNSQKYVISIPIVVINELKGLSLQEEDWLGSQAKLALQLIQQTDSKQENSKKILEVVTTAGHRLRGINFINEEINSDSKEVNDDLILKSCSAFLNDSDPGRNTNNLKKDGVVIERRVVLLTEDRALKVKALIQNVPVRTIVSFVKWAGIP